MRKTLLTALLSCGLFITEKAYTQNEFITEWVTTDGSITIPTNSSSGTYLYDVKYYLKDNPSGALTTTGVSGDYNISMGTLNITDTLVV